MSDGTPKKSGPAKPRKRASTSSATKRGTGTRKSAAKKTTVSGKSTPRKTTSSSGARKKAAPRKRATPRRKAAPRRPDRHFLAAVLIAFGLGAAVTFLIMSEDAVSFVSDAVDALPEPTRAAIDTEPPRRTAEPPQEPPPAVVVASPTPTTPPTSTPRSTRPPVPPRDQPQLCIILDDLGDDFPVARALARLPGPLTMAVLPLRPYSSSSAILCREGGHEIILHLPMQPEAYPEVEPGPGALLLGDGPEQVAENLRASLQSVPGAIGLNNHMGSAYTADRSGMEHLLRLIPDYDLFFVDSFTTAKSVGYPLAKSLGIPTARRDVFLDNSPEHDAIRAMLAKAERLARQRGRALAIGHARASTWEVLRDELPRLQREGIRLVGASEYVRSYPVANP